MATFIKYLLSLALHTAWMRAGKSGPVPRVPLPRGKGHLPLPVIGPWQMLLVTWAARKLWQRYGDDVRAQVGKVDHPAAQRVHDWIPSTGTPRNPARATSQPPATFTTPATATPATATAAASAPARSARTQPLPPQTPLVAASGAATSLLSRLRKGA
jgi:hypothetical protein